MCMCVQPMAATFPSDLSPTAGGLCYGSSLALGPGPPPLWSAQMRLLHSHGTRFFALGSVGQAVVLDPSHPLPSKRPDSLAQIKPVFTFLQDFAERSNDLDPGVFYGTRGFTTSGCVLLKSDVCFYSFTSIKNQNPTFGSSCKAATEL